MQTHQTSRWPLDCRASWLSPSLNGVRRLIGALLNHGTEGEWSVQLNPGVPCDFECEEDPIAWCACGRDLDTAVLASSMVQKVRIVYTYLHATEARKGLRDRSCEGIVALSAWLCILTTWTNSNGNKDPPMFLLALDTKKEALL